MESNTKPSQTTSRVNRANLAPGFAVLLLAAIAVAIGFSIGAKMIPFGGIAIVACVISAVQMIKRQSAAPGYASFFIAVPAVVAAIFMPV